MRTVYNEGAITLSTKQDQCVLFGVKDEGMSIARTSVTSNGGLSEDTINSSINARWTTSYPGPPLRGGIPLPHFVAHPWQLWCQTGESTKKNESENRKALTIGFSSRKEPHFFRLTIYCHGTGRTARGPISSSGLIQGSKHLILVQDRATTDPCPLLPVKFP